MKRRLHSESGQSSTEYMLLISVVVVAVVAAAYTFVPTFQDGVACLAADVSSILDSGSIGNAGLNRGGSSSSGHPDANSSSAPAVAPNGKPVDPNNPSMPRNLPGDNIGTT